MKLNYLCVFSEGCSWYYTVINDIRKQDLIDFNYNLRHRKIVSHQNAASLVKAEKLRQ